MNTTHDAVVGRRSFLRRTAGLTAGAAAFVAAGLNTSTTFAAPAPSPVAGIEPTAGLSVELFDLTTNKRLGYFTSCTNIGSESEIIEHKVTDSTGKTVIQKIPGRLQYLDVTLSSGVGNDNLILDWRRLLENGDTKGATRDVHIIVRGSDGQMLFRWRLTRAWPAEFIVRNDAPLVEFLTIACEKVVREL